MPEGWNKYQFSKFVGEDQYVVRSDDATEFSGMVERVKKITPPIKAQQTQNSAPNSDDRPKRAYKHTGDLCTTCNVGHYVETMKTNKAGEKYKMLICDQTNCKGDAYISKYPRAGSPTATPFGAYAEQPPVEINFDDNDRPF